MRRSHNFLKRFLLFIILFSILSSFLIDPDFGWHMAIGEHFLKTGEIIRGDIFSWTMPGYVWGNSYVLYEIGLAYLYEAIGYGFLVLVFGALGALGFVVLVKEINLQNSLIAVLAATLARVNLGLRPHIFSFLFFALFLLFIEKKLYRKPLLNVFVFLGFALWANIHRGFVFALFVYAVYFFFEYLKEKKIERGAIVSFVVAIMGTFVTPFPFKLYSSGVAGDFLTWENLFYIAEWQQTALFYPINILFAFSGAVFAYAFIFWWKKINPTWFIVGAVSFSLAFLSVSLMSFWALLLVFLTSRSIKIDLQSLKYVGWREWAMVTTVIALCTLGIFLNFITVASQRWTISSALIKSGYPVEALSFINEKKITGNMLNDYGWGGYLIWQGGGRQVFIDGRMAGWRKDGKSILGEYVNFLKGECEYIQGYEIDFVLIDVAQPLYCFDGFDEVYRDGLAKVLVKS